MELTIIGKKLYGESSSDNSAIKAFQHQLLSQIEALSASTSIQWLDRVPYAQLGPLLRRADVAYVTYEGQRDLNDYFSAPGKAFDYLREGLVLLTDDRSLVLESIQAADCAAVFSFPVSSDGVYQALSLLLRRREEIPLMKSRALALFQQHLCLEKQIGPLFHYLGIHSEPEAGQRKQGRIDEQI